MKYVLLGLLFIQGCAISGHSGFGIGSFGRRTYRTVKMLERQSNESKEVVFYQFRKKKWNEKYGDVMLQRGWKETFNCINKQWSCYEYKGK